MTLNGHHYLTAAFISDGLLRLGARTVEQRINEALQKATAAATQSIEAEQGTDRRGGRGDRQKLRLAKPRSDVTATISLVAGAQPEGMIAAADPAATPRAPSSPIFVEKAVVGWGNPHTHPHGEVLPLRLGRGCPS